MKGVFVLAAGLLLAPLPALSQSSSDQSERTSSGSRSDLEDLLRGIGDEVSGGVARRGAGFLLRSGDATVAVRCDPRESMRACVEATTTLLERGRNILGAAGGTGSTTTSPTPPR